MSARSRSPRAMPADLHAALAAAEAALAAAEAALAAERARAAALQWRWLDTLHSMARDARELAAIARRAGASGDLVDHWYAAPPPLFEPEEEPDPR